MRLTKEDNKLFDSAIDNEVLHAPIVETFSKATWADAQHVGIYRRIEQDDPAEMVRGTLISARQRWNSYATQRERNRYQDVLWREVLSSAAIHDWSLHNKMLDCLPSQGRGPADVSCELIIYERLIAAITHSDLSEEHFKHKEFATRRHPYISAVVECIDSLSSGRSEDFCAGMSRLLAASRNDRSATVEDRLICIHAHGLWEVARRIDNQLVESWDTAAKLPWDADFHQFIQCVRDANELMPDHSCNTYLRELIALKELR